MAAHWHVHRAVWGCDSDHLLYLVQGPEGEGSHSEKEGSSQVNTKQFLTVILLAGALGAGCSTLIPKKVELFQDKVATVPEPKPRELEVQRQAAQRAHEKAREALDAAFDTQAAPQVVVPVQEVEKLTEAVSVSLGPPLKPAPTNVPSAVLATELRTAVAKLNQRMDDFKADNNENAGKKIEGTGLFQVPYFVWLGGFLLFAFIGVIVLGVLWSFVKMFAMTNPPTQLGVSAVQLGTGFVKRALSEVAKGGEEFKKRLSKTVSDPALQGQIKDLFREEQLKAQSRDTQDLLGKMTEKG
jgi:hypothetical protein